MGKADLLSRHSDLDGGEKTDKNVMILKAEWFNHVLAIESLDDDLIRHIRQSFNNKDRSVNKALENKHLDW